MTYYSHFFLKNKFKNVFTLYIFLDNNKENSINVTAQLSQHMNLQANKIQCMKASFDDIFYNELEPMEQDEIYGKKN